MAWTGGASLHVEAMGWLRFGKRMSYVATEVGKFNADVLGADASTLVEIEIKKSKSDLKRDFQEKTWKHMIYNGPGNDPGPWVPNLFYFLVPQELGDWAKEQLDAAKTPAGLLVMHKPSFSTGFVPRGNLLLRKRPKVIHQFAPTPTTLAKIAVRMANELCGLRVLHDFANANVQDVLKAIHSLGETPDVVQAIDPHLPPDSGDRPGQGHPDERGVRGGDHPGTDGEVPPPPNCS